MIDSINFPYMGYLITMPPEFLVYWDAAHIKPHKSRMCRYCKMDLAKNPQYIKHANHDNGCKNCFHYAQATTETK